MKNLIYRTVYDDEQNPTAVVIDLDSPWLLYKKVDTPNGKSAVLVPTDRICGGSILSQIEEDDLDMVLDLFESGDNQLLKKDGSFYEVMYWSELIIMREILGVIENWSDVKPC